MKRERLTLEGGFLAGAIPAPAEAAPPPAAKSTAPQAPFQQAPVAAWPPPPPSDLAVLVRCGRLMADGHQDWGWARTMRQLADALAPYIASEVAQEDS